MLSSHPSHASRSRPGGYRSQIARRTVISAARISASFSMREASYSPREDQLMLAFDSRQRQPSHCKAAVHKS